MKRRVPRLQGLAKKVGKGELIGLTCRVASANDAGIVGLEGEVIGETLRTLELRLRDRRMVLAKHGAVFAFQLPKGDWVEIPGEAIGFRPQERLKKVR